MVLIPIQKKRLRSQPVKIYHIKFPWRVIPIGIIIRQDAEKSN